MSLKWLEVDRTPEPVRTRMFSFVVLRITD